MIIFTVFKLENHKNKVYYAAHSGSWNTRIELIFSATLFAFPSCVTKQYPDYKNNKYEETIMKKRIIPAMIGFAALSCMSQSVFAACTDVSRASLESAVAAAATGGKSATGGYGLSMWATMVDETGKVCHVVTSGVSGATAGNNEWLGSRVISAQKANTANAFSLDGYAISTANLYSAVQPGGSLFGLQFSNPVAPVVAYAGAPAAYGTATDPLMGKRVGGINVFGGGLALYLNGKKVGAIGVSGDTSCRDHAFAWRVRAALGAHPVGQPTGAGITTSNMDASGTVQTALPGASKGDEMILNAGAGVAYWDAWSQPTCPNSLPAAADPLNGTILN
jgi:uncharacterized protein GlcG (DUF336 family)